ncbi:MAG: class I SAM-dependent methyltransferase [Candidatus Methanoperedens sp.]
MKFPKNSYYRASIETRLVKELKLLDLYLPRPQDRVLLDVGVGAGPYLDSYLERGFRVIGLDNARQGLSDIYACYGKSSPNAYLNLMAGDAKNLPLQDNSVDVVFMCEILEHLNDPTSALREAQRVLKPGGWLFIDMPWWHEVYRPISACALRQLQSFKSKHTPPLLLQPFFSYHDGTVSQRSLGKTFLKLIRLFPTFRGINPESFMENYVNGEVPEGNMHLHFYTPKEWCRIVESTDFEVKAVTGAWLTPPPFNRLSIFNRITLNIESHLPNIVLSRIGQTLVIVASKPWSPT